MNQLGRPQRATLDPPVKALFVYNCNPAAVAPDQEAGARGLLREDLFTVVHEQFPTDTADYADIVLPATTQLEHFDIHKAYGHLYVSLNKPAIAPLGESVSNTDLFRRLAARMGFDDPCLRESDEQMARQAFLWDHERMAGIDFERLEREDVGPPERPRPLPALRRRRLSHAVGQVRARVGQARGRGARPARRATRRRARGRRARPSSRSATRSPSSRRPRTTS